MNRITFRRNAAVLALAAAAFAGAHAQSADAPLSRDQVRAELADAQRQGGLQAAGELALVAGPRPVAAAGAGLTRAEVRADVLRARRDGTLLAAGDSIARDAHGPRPLAASTQLAGKSREQVKAEFAEARRNGELLVAGESGLSQREQAPLRFRGTPSPSAPVLAEAVGGPVAARSR